MPEASLEISVSQREIDRPRLLEALALREDGSPLEGMALRLTVDSNGTFAEDSECTGQEIVTGRGGLAYFQWWGFPRSGPRRDFVSTIRAIWDSERALVYLQDLHE